MERSLRNKITEMLNGDVRERRRIKIIGGLAAIVVFCTVYALILPAITMENTAYCGLEEHKHEAACYEQKLICTLEESEEHAHAEACYEDSLICTLTEHTHEEACFVDPNAEEEVADEQSADTSKDAADADATAEESAAGEGVTPNTTAADTSTETEGEEATKDPAAEAYDSLNARDKAAVDEVIELIADLPDADTVEQTLADYEDADDMDGYEAYYTEVGQQGRAAYEAYDDLSEDQKAAVSNSDRLFDLEWLWSAVTLIDEITSDKPTTVRTASTSEFIDLNLYDYTSRVNELYYNTDNISYYGYNDSKGWHSRTTSIYPGFQWNGGAYLNSALKKSFSLNGKKVTSADRNVVDSIDFGNSLITDYDYAGSNNAKSTTSTDIVINDNWLNNSRNSTAIKNRLQKNINLIDVDVATTTDYGVTNRPVGMSWGTDILSKTLGSDGYPVLADGATSLSYLFTDGYYAQKQNSSSIDGLFQQNATTGEYYFNSRENHAQYNDTTETFDVYNQIITPNFIVYPFGNFLPLNDITKNANATQVSKITRMSNYIENTITDLGGVNSSNATKNQLADMLTMYKYNVQYYGINGKTWSTFNAKDAIFDYFKGDQDGDNPTDDTSLITDSLLKKMYNIDWDVETNFFFGMDMTMNFMQPKDGMTGNDTNGDGKSDYPMNFYFTGDDDVWVYVDDVLFLDLTGIHRHVGGEIDFVNGIVNYYYLDTENTGDVSSKPYKSYTFEELFAAAGKTAEFESAGKYTIENVNGNGVVTSTRAVNAKRFKDYTTHEFKFFYMERGSGSSVCRLNFNFPLLKQNTISVGKNVTGDEDVLGEAEYKFQVLKANADGTKTNNLFIGGNVAYNVLDADGNQIQGEFYTDENGVFTLKKGQTAEFTGIKENAGSYYVRELLTSDEALQYGNIKILGGSSATTSGTVQVGQSTFVGADSNVTDMSHGSTKFIFDNEVNKNKTGKLQIEKVLDSKYTGQNKDFTFNVLLGGKRIAVGTPYKVTKADGTTENKTVANIGEIVIKGGEKAVIENILVGTAFNVSEKASSAEGYIVTYAGSDITSDGSSANGFVNKAATTVGVKVTNAENGASVDIPLEKILANPDDGSYTYNFSLKRVDSDEDPLSASIKVTKDNSTVKVDKGFTLTYLATNSEIKNIAKGSSKEFHYQVSEVDNIIEAGKVDHTAANATVYDVYVTVSKDNNGKLSATKVIKKGETAVDTATFTNTLIGDLVISKVVEGAKTSEEGFKFDVVLKNADGSALSGKFGDYEFDENGKYTITIKPETEGTAKKVSIPGLPVGTKWTVTEQANTEFVPSIVVPEGSDAEIENDSTASGTITTAGTELEVAYTNKSAYKLPLTGGEGTTRYIMGGCLLMVSALVLYTIYRMRRKEDF